ncbi:hypothetical protein BF95_26675 [Sphingobium sp. Ant17]|nr:hypothetical protein BF95_26675 [Sphingobium sp. Ant17]
MDADQEGGEPSAHPVNPRRDQHDRTDAVKQPRSRREQADTLDQAPALAMLGLGGAVQPAAPRLAHRQQQDRRQQEPRHACRDECPAPARALNDRAAHQEGDGQANART